MIKIIFSIILITLKNMCYIKTVVNISISKIYSFIAAFEFYKVIVSAWMFNLIVSLLSLHISIGIWKEYKWLLSESTFTKAYEDELKNSGYNKSLLVTKSSFLIVMSTSFKNLSYICKNINARIDIGL